MLGDGWEQWLSPGLTAPLRAAPHAMTMPRAAPSAAAAAQAPPPHTPPPPPSELLRLWYGRMYLPPSDALLPPHGFPFERVRTAWRQQEEDDEDADEDAELRSVGCAGGGRRQLQDADGCFANQVPISPNLARPPAPCPLRALRRPPAAPAGPPRPPHSALSTLR